MALVCSHLGDRLILFPQGGVVAARGASRILLPQPSGVLEVWKARSAATEPAAFVLRFYGNADRADRWVADEAASYAEHSLEFWGVNYPGFGGSTGPARLAAIGAAATIAYDALAKVAGGRPIFIFGTSLGTTAALGLAATRPVTGLMLQNPPPLPELIRGHYGWWNLWLLALPISMQIPPSLDSLANAARARAPAIFIGSENDEIVGPEFQQMVVDAYAGPKVRVVLARAHHNDAVSPASAAKIRREFSTNLLRALGSVP
jgi:uncharacterized protein